MKGAPKHILIVDDNATLRKLLAEILEVKGYATSEASDGEEALRLLEKTEIDAVISDILMSGMDGYRFCYEVRRSRKHSTLPFIFLTAAYTSPGDEQHALDLGADKILRKPFSAIEVLNALREMFENPLYQKPRTIKPIKEVEVIKQYTDRLVKKLEEKIIELQQQSGELEKLSVAIEHIADSVVITNKEGVIEYVNPAFERNTGYTKEFAIGKTPTILKSGKHDAAFYEKLWKTILSGKIFREEFINRKSSGEFYYEQQAISPVLDNEGKIVHFICAGRDVTRRKITDDQLRSAHAQLQELVDHSPAVIFKLKIEQGRVHPYVASENIIHLLGFTVDESRSFEWWATHVHPDDKGRVYASVEDTLQRETLTCEYRLRNKSGEYIWVEDNRRVLRDRARRSREIIGVWTDITERKRAEVAIKESETKFKTLFERANDAIFIMDAEVFLDCNLKTEIMFGCRKEDIIGRSPIAFSPPIQPDGRLSSEKAKEKINAALGGLPQFFEWKHIQYDGTPFDVEVGLSRLDIGETYYLQAIVRDITERKRGEEQLKLLAHTIGSARDCISIADLEDNLIFVNRSFCELYGYSQEEILGKKVSVLRAASVKPEQAEQIFRETLAGSWHGEVINQRKDGSEFPIELWTSAVEDASGQIVATVGVSRDVTKQRQLEQQFLRAQRMESIGTLAGGIAHDLNNVLAPIVMGIEMLKSKVTDEGSQKMLRTLAASAQRGSGMVKQVLAFARGVSGERVVLDVGHLIREMQAIVRDTFPKSIQFSSEVSRGLWSVSVDATQLHQVLLNLCVNARDAMPSGGILTITAENTVTDKNFAQMNAEAKAGPYVVLTVTDTGTGIPQDLLDKVFDPFFTTKEIDKGTGLGLSTVHGIVKSHGGFIDVYSEVGRGTKFRVYIPAETTAVEKQAKVEQDELPNGHGELILLVDDEASIRDICRATLESYGYNVLTAADGTEAIVQYAQRRNEIRLVITDMMMPFMDGRATIRALCNINPDVKIIATSGLAEEKSIDYRDLPVSAFLAKPYTAPNLLAAVSHILGKKVTSEQDGPKAEKT